MIYFIFIVLCLVISTHGTTVQLWTSDNKLIADVSSHEVCYELSSSVRSELHRYYVEYNSGTVYWFNSGNCNGDSAFYSTSTGYINYWEQGDEPAAFYISGDLGYFTSVYVI